MDNSTIIGLLINAIALIIAIFKLSLSLNKDNKLRERQDVRTEYKLRIYNILLSSVEDLTIDEIIVQFRNMNPLSASLVDEVEIRKSIYEMLVECTIVCFNDGTYAANTEDD